MSNDQMSVTVFHDVFIIISELCYIDASTEVPDFAHFESVGYMSSTSSS